MPKPLRPLVLSQVVLCADKMTGMEIGFPAKLLGGVKRSARSHMRRRMDVKTRRTAQKTLKIDEEVAHQIA